MVHAEAQRLYHRPVQFAGVMTQHVLGCACGYLPPKAHQVFARELAAAVGHDAPEVPTLVTNIRAAE